MLSPSHSITRCIDMLKRGDRAAAEALWDSYIHRLVALAARGWAACPAARPTKRTWRSRAFDSFFRRAECGQFARLTDRDDLWQILVVITERKAIDLMRHEGRKSRGEGRVVAFSDVEGQGPATFVDPGPTPEFAAQVVDEFRDLLRRLGDDSLRSVALAKMEGYTNKQIADRLGCIEQTVERKLRSIRRSGPRGVRHECLDLGRVRQSRRSRPSAPSNASATDSRPRGSRACGPSIEDYLTDTVGPTAREAFAGIARASTSSTGAASASGRHSRSTITGFPASRSRDRGRVQSRPSRATAGRRTTRDGLRRRTCAVPTIPGYTVLEELGRGGMGVVFKATAERLNRFVALKMILSGDLASPEAGVRFLKEAEAVARLQHPQVVQIFRIGDFQGRPYLEMEYVDGGSLADRLDGRPWKPADAARLIESLAMAVHHAHVREIVHRDLKPANILLTADGMPKVTDFGLAKSLGADIGLTRTDSIIGSPSYMAPEQAGGTASRIGPATDVYSLGAILVRAA